jgi:tRNA(Met) C34 N-acetyltransferase TmcA
MTAVIPKEKGNLRSQLRKKMDAPGLRIFRHATDPRFCKRGYGNAPQREGIFVASFTRRWMRQGYGSSTTPRIHAFAGAATAPLRRERGNLRSQLRKKMDAPGLRIFPHATDPRFCKRGYGNASQREGIFVASFARRWMRQGYGSSPTPRVHAFASAATATLRRERESL